MNYEVINELWNSEINKIVQTYIVLQIYIQIILFFIFKNNKNS